MKKYFLTFFIVAFSLATHAQTYQCKIDQSDLGPDFNGDLQFELYAPEGKKPSLSILGDLVSDSCSYESLVVVLCRDAERMPYRAEIIDNQTVILSVGFFIDQAYAECTSKSK